MKMARMLTIVAVGLVVAVQASGATYYVDANGSGDFTTIQAALDDPCTVDGDEIEVAPGTYYEAIDFNGTGVRLYSSGGAGVTTIDANGADHAVKCVSGEDANTILEGFTITGGVADGASWPDMHGAGMVNDGSSPTVTDCNFTGNQATDTGGGMCNTDSSNPTVTNCTFIGNNSSDHGGGMSNVTNCSPTLINCTFSGNTAGLYGGGVINSVNCSPKLTNCTFSDNTAGDGGGMWNGYGSNPTVTNCILWDNTPDEILDYDYPASTSTVSFSDVQGGWSGAGGNNIYGDPVFVDAANGDLRLGSCSPCVDAGSNAAVPTGVTTDLGGDSRFVDDTGVADTGAGTAPIVDMGAYERQMNSSSAPVHNITQDVNYCSIQLAIDDANDGDQIKVWPGTYYEAIDFKGKAIELYSSDGPEVTTIDGTGHYHVVQCRSSEGPDTVLEGFTITGGNANGPDPNDGRGGGMYCESSGPTITNCIFSGNSASFDFYSSGGGMCNYNHSSPTVTNCTFSGNYAHNSGGMANFYYSSPTVTDCNFTGNNSTNFGGGMANFYYSSPTVTNCTFSDNTARNGGGMLNAYDSSPTVINSTFSGNSAEDYGGGMFNTEDSNPTVTNCTFRENNTADLDGGGMCNYGGSSPTVTNCIFRNNSSKESGGGMYNFNSNPTVTNCILWGDMPDEIYDDATSSATVTYSDVYGGWPGVGNINISPLFVDVSGGDFRFNWYSPCIDAGDNNAPGLPATDLAGNPRVVDGDGDGNAVVDMGLYELEAGLFKIAIGTLEVTIEPNEAIDAGAKWKVESTDQWFDSGVVVLLPPGYHKLDFNGLPDWSEPEKLLVGYDTVDFNEVPQQTLWVRVIGDMNAVATAEYKPLPAFDIGQIPPRDAPHGRTLEFHVDANWLGDGVFFSLTTTFDSNYPEPAGPILIDPVSGLFTYEPNDVNDRTAFTVTFRAESVIDVNEQAVKITPIPALPLEYEIVSRPVQDIPDPESRDYIFVNEILSDTNEVLNGIERQVRSVTIAGKSIVVSDGLVSIYSDAHDIRDMTIYAETLVLDQPLNLPQTNVAIYAKMLDFTAVADINTTPIDDRVDTNEPMDGLPAGNISLYIESYDGNERLNGHLIMNGTKGYNGGSCGDDGVLTCTLDNPQPLAWLSPYALKMVIAYARDAYLYRYTAETHDILSEYEGLLSVYMALPDWNDLPERWQFEFEQMHQEIITLLHGLDNGLDYFGNPPDWVPALSFEVLYTVYEQEIDHAIRVLYLTYWLQNEANDISKKEAALSNGRDQLWDDIVQARDDYNICKDLIGPLKARAGSIANKIGRADGGGCYGLLCDLKKKEAELLERAKRNVQEANKVPEWKTALGVISTICTSTITAGAVGSVGGPVGAVVGVFAGASIGTISVLADDSLMNPNPWPEASMRTDVAKQFNSIDFDQATEGWIDDFNDIESLSDIEDNGANFYLQTLQASAADMADGLWGVKDALKTTLLDDEEVEAKLKEIKATDPTFNRLIDDVTELMVEKQLFNRQLAAAMQKVAYLSNSMTNNVLAIDAMNRDASYLNQIVDPSVNMYLKDMERRTLARLRKYHYYMAKAYEYRLLEPYPGDLGIDELFNKIKKHAADPCDPVNTVYGRLGPEDFDALKAVYEDQLSTLAEDILYEFLDGRQEMRVPTEYVLSEEEISQLNAGEAVTVNLFEEGLFPSKRENIRIVDMNVADDINVVVDGNCGGYGYFILTMYHPSVSKLQWKDHIYLFRHLAQDTKEPLDIEWTSEYHPKSGSLYHDRPSPSSQSLLWTLLSEASRGYAMIYSRPGAWADIVITKEDIKELNCQMDIQNLTFVVQYDYFTKEIELQTLRVATEPNIPFGLSRYELLPYFLVDTADESGRGDGIGDFYRIYHADLEPTVNVTAPKTYGNWRFDKWTDKYGGPLWSDLTLPVYFSYQSGPPPIRTDQTVYAQYMYEGPIPSIADFDEDYDVDFADYAALSHVWLTEPADPEWDPLYDVSDPPDDFIDWWDLAVLCDNWLEGL